MNRLQMPESVRWLCHPPVMLRSAAGAMSVLMQICHMSMAQDTLTASLQALLGVHNISVPPP